MLRSDRLVIRLNEEERAVVDRLAEKVRLPPSTFARKMLLDEAERRGLLLDVAKAGQEEQHDH